MNYGRIALRSCLNLITMLLFDTKLLACDQHYRAILVWHSIMDFIEIVYLEVLCSHKKNHKFALYLRWECLLFSGSGYTSVMQINLWPVSSTHFNYIISIKEGVNKRPLHVFRNLSTYLPVFKDAISGIVFVKLTIILRSNDNSNHNKSQVIKGYTWSLCQEEYEVNSADCCKDSWISPDNIIEALFFDSQCIL